MDFKEETEIEKGDVVFIFQHPGGKGKQFSNDKIIRVNTPYVYYEANTDGGSSGSPVLRNFKVVAIHHTGNIVQGYNYGTLCSAIIEHLNTGKCKLILFRGRVSVDISGTDHDLHVT